MFNAEFENPTLPNVTLQIGGKVRNLAFDYKAIITAEKVAGVNLLRDTFDASFTTLGGLLYAALLHDDSTVTLDQVGSWINFKNSSVVYQAILAAWIGSLPAPKDGEQGEDQAAGQAKPAA